MRRGWRGVIVLGLLQLAAAVAAVAAPEGQRPAARWRADAGAPLGMFNQPRAGAFGDQGGIPRDQVIDMVQRRFNARVVRVNLVESGGRRVYEMRLLSEQRVWNVRVDADTGQVLEGGN
jgi:uncharacterized membrane protein YkoI